MRIKLNKNQNDELLTSDFSLELAALALEAKAVQAAVKPSTAKTFTDYAAKLRKLEKLLLQIREETLDASEARRQKRLAAKTLGSLGGSSRSKAKANASRENGKLGGRPRLNK